MGGRGAFSYSGNKRSNKSSKPLNAYAVASLNTGVASGTTTDAAIDRFREQLMGAKVEYSGYIDNAGYIHALGSTNQKGSTKVAPLSATTKESGVSTVIHNHPHGNGRIWGGPFSQADLAYIVSAHRSSNGSINRIIATSNEGIYSAKVTKSVSDRQVSLAAKRADKAVSGKKYQSELSMWRAVNSAYTTEFAKIGVDITYTKKNAKSNKKLVTQKIGVYV